MIDRTKRRGDGWSRRSILLPTSLVALATAAMLFIAPAPRLEAQSDGGFGPPAPPKVEGPRILIPEPAFDWGEVLHGGTIEHVFKVKNVGSETLRITNVKPG